MTPHFRHVALIGKYQSQVSGAAAAGSLQLMEDIAGFLLSQGCKVAVEARTAAATGLNRYPALDADAIGEQCDLGLVVGGDGTMLSIGRQLARHGTPLIGINQGRLGFVTDIPLENYQATLTPMLHGEYEEDHRPLMHARVEREGRIVFDAFAMNDVVVNRGATSGMVELRVEVDGHFVANQRADGLIIASPTGSTAYAFSLGGPIIWPDVQAFLLVPMAAHALFARPMVVAPDSLVDLTLSKRFTAHATVSCDGRRSIDISPGARLQVRRGEHNLRVARLQEQPFTSRLVKKFELKIGGFRGSENP